VAAVFKQKEVLSKLLQVIGNSWSWKPFWKGLAMAAKVQTQHSTEAFKMPAHFQESSPDAVRSKSAHRPERRQRPRTLVNWPVVFFRNHAGGAIETATQNLSSCGFYCLSRTPLTAGEFLFCTLRVPSHEASSPKSIRVLECRVRVTRAEPALEGFFGIACQIEDYRVIAPSLNS
jgi:hypothetical protein